MTFFVLSRLQSNYMAANERNKTKKTFSLKGYITNDNFYRLRTRHLKTARWLNEDWFRATWYC